MTESKMTKILTDLSEKQDYGVFYLIDVWQTDESKKVREVIKVSDIAEEFKKKEGRFYELYRLGSDFKKLHKHLLKKEEMKIECRYEDTYEAYMTKWKEEHPNEKSYGDWVRKMKKIDHRKYIEYISSLGLFGSPYFIRNRVY